MEEQKSVKDLVNENRYDGSRDAIPTPPNCPSCGAKGTELPPRPLRERGGAQLRGEGSLTMGERGKLFRKHAPALLSLSFRNNISHINHNVNSQSLINVTGLFAYLLIGLFTFINHSTHLTHFRKRPAFTLAEVLVTLSVISIVAAMTIPNLVQSYKKKEVETKLLRFYSVINNAIALSEIDNGNKTTWSEPNDFTDAEVTELGGKSQLDAWLIKYIVPYVKITKKEFLSTNGIKLYFSDGTALRVNNSHDMAFYINPSCTKPARCFFNFNFAPKGGTYFGYSKNKGVEPYNFNLNINNAEAWCKKKDEMMPGQVSGYAYCTMWIKQNGWKIPEDYPYKF